MQAKSTIREARAQQLITDGKVRLFPGRGYAEVVGSRGAVYRITKQLGCSCPNGLGRDSRSCYHSAATRLLCQEYRLLAQQARRGETVRPSVGLLRAIGWEVGEQSPAPAGTGALVDDKGVAYCHRCGHDLINGQCPREAAERRERMAA